MSFERKLERTQLKGAWKRHNEGVSKKHRTSFSDFWKSFRKYKKEEMKNGR